MKKKLLIIFSILTLLLLTVLISFFLRQNPQVLQNTSLVIPTPTLPDPNQENQVTPIYEEKDAPFAITLSNITGAYLITILKSPFEENRLKAEQYFLEKLNISKEDACKLKVNLGTMRFANPNQAGQTFHLSFCNN